MPETGSDDRNAVLRALATLQAQLLDHPAVSLIDVGEDPEDRASGRLVLRVHIRRPLSELAGDFPSEVDGVPVRLLRGDYRIE